MRDAAEYIIGNLDEDGYLTAGDEELLEGYVREQGVAAEVANDEAVLAAKQKAAPQLTAALKIVQMLDPVGIATRDLRECLLVQIEAQKREFDVIYKRPDSCFAEWQRPCVRR